MRWPRFIALALLLAWTAPALAVLPDEVLRDPALEARARDLSKELRCMVCQNQSIDDSDAPLARDLRVLVRERLQGGDSDHQVIDFLVARYGDFVLLRPRFTWHTALLWLGPPATLIAGMVVLFVVGGRRHRHESAEAVRPEEGHLTPAEEARLKRLMSARET